MEDDPFGSFISHCQPTSSQEDRLRTCPFAREDDVFPQDESPSSEPNVTPVEPTGIFMLSLPDSSKADSSPHEDFQTPPEGSLLASSEEQRTTAVDALAYKIKMNKLLPSLLADTTIDLTMQFTLPMEIWESTARIVRTLC